ncbi:uncharacterized protein TrAFT101_002391 [Trichoderma asperellum]|uniref:uncharacterized protein n=1 Tax=Trichoderma asperellum TaxID=101201 RepID=UPI003326B4C3|nr:hypothetical protein TrAFT101_002391 [Trichoderma asperellum]
MNEQDLSKTAETPQTVTVCNGQNGDSAGMERPVVGNTKAEVRHARLQGSHFDAAGWRIRCGRRAAPAMPGSEPRFPVSAVLPALTA